MKGKPKEKTISELESSAIGQDVGEAILWAEAKLGELLAAMPKPKFDKQLNGSFRGTTGTLPKGVTRKESHEAQTLTKHPELIKEVIGWLKSW